MESGFSALFGCAEKEAVKLNVVLTAKHGEVARTSNAEMSA